ncbi:MAG TPA: sigma-70 family RNA polymerase sigma factor [Solirubrobacteraceae bacterium]|nr:sigma-70 family RNA polymerase sigma factor [Solirubrobacteraceae bacterium]
MRGSAGAERDAETVAWVRSFRAHGREREDAVRELHRLLLGVARRELRRRSLAVEISGPELDDLAHQAAADALLAITAKLDDFRGESRFTTWAYGFVILEVSNKLGRHFWRSPSASSTDEDWSRLPDRLALDPQSRAEWHDLVDALRRGVDECLTAQQRRLFVAIVLNAVPLDAMVVELGSNRNAIYKSLYDARRKLRRWLVAQGYLDCESAR